MLHICYFILQTAALDGETDLKTRVVASACMGIDSELLHKIKVKCNFFTLKRNNQLVFVLVKMPFLCILHVYILL